MQYTLIKNAIEEWFDLVVDLYIEDSKKYTGDTVRKLMTNSINICNYMSKDEVKKELFKFINTLEKYEK
jgi:ATP sulfurylase